MNPAEHQDLKAAGWTPLAGPIGVDEEYMIKGFVADAEACNKDTCITEMGYTSGGYPPTAKMIWQRSKRLAAAA